MKYLGKISDPKDLVTKEYVDNNDVFIAKYGTTTYSEVADARTAGKIILAASSTYDSIHVFNADIAGEEFSFTMPTGNDYISEWSLDDNNTWTSSQIDFGTTDSFYTTSSTTAATAAKTTATVSGYKLRTGNIISVYFSYANTVEDALTLKIGATDVKAIWHNNATTSSSNPLLWSAGDIVTFVYSGSVYRVISINTFAANKDFFIATYNSTTFATIYSEYNKGKHILCVAGDTLFTLQRITSTQAKFVSVDMDSNYQITTYTVSSGGWSVTNQYPVLSINGYSPTSTSYGAVSVQVGYANSTNSTSKLFLVGATTQAREPNTYSNSDVYATNGALNAKSFSVDTSANIVYNSSTKSIDFTFN